MRIAHAIPASDPEPPCAEPLLASPAKQSSTGQADLWEGPNGVEMRVPPLVAGCGEKPPRSPAPAAERPDRREGQHGDEM